MHRAKVSLLALCAAAATACQYAERRWNDFTDVGSISVGMGVEGSVKVGEFLHLGLGSSLSTETAPLFLPIPALYQLVYGDTPLINEHWLPWSLVIGQRYGVPMVAHSINWETIYPYGPTATRETRQLHPELSRWVGAPPQHRCFMLAPFHLNRDAINTDPRHWIDVEVSVFLLFGAKLRFRPFEAIDFVLGIFPGFDFMGDDELPSRVILGPYWYKTPRETELTEPFPPEVPVGVERPQDPVYAPQRP